MRLLSGRPVAVDGAGVGDGHGMLAATVEGGAGMQALPPRGGSASLPYSSHSDGERSCGGEQPPPPLPEEEGMMVALQRSAHYLNGLPCFLLQAYAACGVQPRPPEQVLPGVLATIAVAASGTAASGARPPPIPRELFDEIMVRSWWGGERRHGVGTGCVGGGDEWPYLLEVRRGEVEGGRRPASCIAAPPAPLTPTPTPPTPVPPTPQTHTPYPSTGVGDARRGG